MLEIGKFHDLEIIKESELGLHLDGLNLNEVLLPHYETPKEYKIGDKLNVFIYKDNKDQVLATLKRPFAQLDDIAYLKVVDTTTIGSFLDWGLDKNLFLPFPEQKKRVEVNEFYIVKVLLDDRDRLIASTIIDDFIDNSELDLEENDKVNVIIYRITDLGYLSIINNKFFGIIYKNEVFEELKVGDKLEVFVKKIRKENKVDLSVNNLDIKRFDNFANAVLQKLKKDNVLNVTDKSSPEEIYKEFAMSKKNFKKAVGALYKKKLIKIEKNQIILIK
jgi:hypothetical protein